MKCPICESNNIKIISSSECREGHPDSGMDILQECLACGVRVEGIGCASDDVNWYTETKDTFMTSWHIVVAIPLSVAALVDFVNRLMPEFESAIYAESYCNEYHSDFDKQLQEKMHKQQEEMQAKHN